MTKLGRLVELNGALRGSQGRKDKVRPLATVISELELSELPIGVAFLCGETRQAKLGIGWAVLRSIVAQAAKDSSLALRDVDAGLEPVVQALGKGSQAVRRAALAELFSRATDQEQDFLRSLILSELRQGALEGLVIEAVAEAAAVPPRRCGVPPC